MKHAEVYINLWLGFHERTRILSTDQWYVNFVNRLVPLVRKSALYKDETAGRHCEIALFLTLYLEDCIADAGNWREFIRWHRRSYGSYLPFFPVPDTYLPDEINREDLAVVLWGLNSGMDEWGEKVEDPFNPAVHELAAQVYDVMDEVFEEAPISQGTAPSWFMSSLLMEKERVSIPVAKLGDELPQEVERFLEASGGESLLYFGTYSEMERFLMEELKWVKDTEEPDEDEDSFEGIDNKHYRDLHRDSDALFPELRNDSKFVVYANGKGVLIAPGVASFFADPRNPFYNSEMARKEAYTLFCRKGTCPFDLLKYAVEYSLIPDVALPCKNGKELFWKNWDFIARWFLEEYYEEG